MKKTLLAVLLAVALPAMSQTAPVSPTAPTIPAMISTSDTAFQAGVTTSLNDSHTNIVYIHQSGSTPTVNITQDGNGNRIGADASGTINPVILQGSNQVVTIVQEGATNSVGGLNNVINTLQLVTTAGSSSVTIQQAGNSNFIDATCGGGSANCNNANINWAFVGNSNTLNFTGSGDHLTSGINVAGSGNQFSIAMTGDYHQQLVNVTGDNNVFNLSQTSASPSSLVLSQNGTGSTFNISQSGTYSNVANIQSTANGGSFNITQRSR
jgi:hypothetical protein